MPRFRGFDAGCFLVLAAALGLAYSNHFDNSFHFDDFHTVVNNTRVHGLGSWRQFFTDPTAFSVLTTHQVFRPLVSLSLAADWAIGGGATRWFHISTFAWLLVLCIALRAVFGAMLNSAAWAWFAVATFALHPVSAETVNYIIQRGDLYATLGIAAALALYIHRPGSYLYLVPFAAGALSKTTALIFPLLLAVYMFWFEDRKSIPRRLAPALAVTLGLGLWAAKMTGAAYTPGAYSGAMYRATQPYVAGHYFKSFFLPTGLSADTDWTVVSSLADPRLFLGLAFLLAIATAIAKATPPEAFGLSWFLLALLPTSIVALAEVTNDHRMFMAFPGLSLAAAGLLRRYIPQPGMLHIGLGALILSAAAAGTFQRNQVWKDEESLWRDVTEKSPRNGRGWMNYGLVFLSRGDAKTALGHFERATTLTPNYHILEINVALAKGLLGRRPEAEAHFQRAIQLEPKQSTGPFYYGRWLHEQGRRAEAEQQLARAVTLNPNDFPAQALLAQVRAVTPTPESLLAQSLDHYRAGRFMDCIRAAQQALALRPNYAEAYNNIAAGYNAQQMWDEGIQAAEQAVRLRPDWDLPRNNLLHARAQKAAGKQ